MPYLPGGVTTVAPLARSEAAFKLSLIELQAGLHMHNVNGLDSRREYPFGTPIILRMRLHARRRIIYGAGI